MSDRGFELLDHPADMGISVWSDSLNGLIEQSVLALTSVLVDLESVKQAEAKVLQIDAASIEDALYQLLSDVLFFFDADKRVYSACLVRLLQQDEDNVKLEVQLSGEKIDPVRHQLKTYIKAITYHQLEIIQGNGNFRAKVFLDI